jgi:gamma-glutamylputrescine oxidase
MKKRWPPQDQVFWYLKRQPVVPCRSSMKVDVAIIGGGMAGLSAAQAFHARGKTVALCEQYYCGSGASGKSSGYITPNAELSFTDFSKRFSLDDAKRIWEFFISGIDDIRSNIVTHRFSCGYSLQDALMLANRASDLKELEIEHKNLTKAGFESSWYTSAELQSYIASKNYVGGLCYPQSFGIDAYAYCQEMKKNLQQDGVDVFEETPVLAIENHTLKTMYADIEADYIVICTDRFMPDLGFLTKEIYHAQTFIMLSQVLTDEQIKSIFPDRRFMVWDTDLIYNYFRMTADHRLLLGGGTLCATYASKPTHDYMAIVNKLLKYVHTKFPELSVQFEYMWPGLIGISKDIGPLAGRDKDKPYLYYISAATGLPIAAALGRYSAEYFIDGRRDLDGYFSPYRSFPFGGLFQSIVGIRVSFALSNFLKTNIP